MKYEEFIQSKITTFQNCGFDIDTENLNPMLFDFQKDIVRWALKKGRAAIFADCGLGKTPMQLEWANQICKHEGGKILILAPLAVAVQTQREGEKFHIPVTICKSQNDVKDGINITNYEKLDKFVASEFTGIVLDESSILKSFTGKVRNQIIDSFRQTPYRLACTATPAPNDYMELGNHSEFLGVMTREEMLSMYFVHDGGQTSKWRLKGHAESKYWEWLASWSVFIDNPKNLGYKVDGYELPALNVNQIVVDHKPAFMRKMTLTQRRNARNSTIDIRCQQAADLVNNSDESWIIWCDLNAESAKLHQLINDNVEVKGSDSNEHKSSSMLDFANDKIHCIVTKPSIAGFGMNWQNCRNMIFVGLSDSYEAYYQAIRRCWRFGQDREVNVYIIISSKEGAVKVNIERKQRAAEKMTAEMIKLTKDITSKELKQTTRITTEYNPTVVMKLPNWL